MHRNHLWGLIACGLLTACGCANSGAVTRGQSPAAMQQASFGYRGSIHEVAEDHFHGRDITHYTVDGPGAMHGGSCPEGCPPDGYGCPPGGHGCPTGACGGNGAIFGAPRHGYSFSYERPNNLVYPPANVPGGAVVYPYYTHKGPSDFFRTK